MIFDVVPWKRSNSKQVVKSAGISTGQCLLKSQEQHSHENTALDAGKLASQEGADTVSSAGIGIYGFWSLLHQDELRYPHDAHHECRWLCNASPHSPHEAVIFISFWQKNVIVPASVRGTFSSTNCAKQLARIAQGLQRSGEAAMPVGHRGSASLCSQRETLRASWCPGHLFLNETPCKCIMGM